MKRQPVILCLAVVIALAGRTAAAPAPPQTLRIFAAASLADAFGDLGRQLERQRPGLAVRTSFAGSQQLASQLEQGASADVFASADQHWMDHVCELGLVAGAPVLFAMNRLVVIVPATNPGRIRALADLARGGLKIVIGADAVPVGHYSRQALQNLAREPGFTADFATRVLRNVVSEEENVKSVVGKVQLGEADAGICYRSDVTPAVARYVRVLEIPESANVVASYPIAVLKGARSDAAQAFVDLVLSKDGQAILAKRGLIPVAP
jgi:molybdate transport system substrate-binding protein